MHEWFCLAGAHGARGAARQRHVRVGREWSSGSAGCWWMHVNFLSHLCVSASARDDDGGWRSLLACPVANGSGFGGVRIIFKKATRESCEVSRPRARVYVRATVSVSMSRSNQAGRCYVHAPALILRTVRAKERREPHKKKKTFLRSNWQPHWPLRAPQKVGVRAWWSARPLARAGGRCQEAHGTNSHAATQGAESEFEHREMLFIKGLVYLQFFFLQNRNSSSFVCIWQILFNYGLTRFKRIVSSISTKLCN